MTRAGSGPTTPEPLVETIELQRLGCELAGSPLYAEVLDAVAADVTAGGACARLLVPFAASPFGDAIVLRFLAAVHHSVLAGEEAALAGQYPSAGGRPGPDLGPCFLDAVERLEGDLVERMSWGVQTNEVGRSVVLLGGYQELARRGLPLRILEVGASAGLNLRFDQYRYRSGPAAVGPSHSPLVFSDPWVGRSTPDLTAMAPVASRQGCDLDPIDPTTEAGRLRLRSLVWPDQPDRRRRLDLALLVTTAHPVRVDQADALTWLEAHLADAAPDQMTVVTHSIVMQYLPVDARRQLVDLIEDAGRRATVKAPLAWLRMEPGGDRAETRLTRWPGGRTDLLSSSSYHGPPVAWTAPRRERR